MLITMLRRDMIFELVTEALVASWQINYFILPTSPTNLWTGLYGKRFFI